MLQQSSKKCLRLLSDLHVRFDVVIIQMAREEIFFFLVEQNNRSLQEDRRKLLTSLSAFDETEEPRMNKSN